jgi:hypothetical protein
VVFRGTTNSMIMEETIESVTEYVTILELDLD